LRCHQLVRGIPPGFVRPLALAIQTVGHLLAAVLLAFTCRRVFFALAIVARRSTPLPGRPGITSVPDVLVLVACRNEAELIGSLARAVGQLDYPTDRCQVVLIDDGSTDATADRMLDVAAHHPGWSVLRLASSQGKAAALNAALAAYAFGDVVYVLDADHRPRPDALLRIVRYLAEPQVAGVSGRTVARNSLASPAAYYASVEADVHQLVTMRAKDRLGLGPALLGSNCAYRRSVLNSHGRFRSGALLEDYDVTSSVYCAGYRVRFAEDAVSDHEVPESVSGYLKQHTRWGRGFYEVARTYARPLLSAPGLSWPLRLDLVVSLLGYLDRVALLGTGLLTLVAWICPRLLRSPWRVLLAALLAPLVQVVALFAEQRAPRSMWLRLPIIPAFLLVDVFAAARSFAEALSNRPTHWAATTRRADTEVA
jgi:cellulose synthase/poly-beta-1,6-N-acetylglucosamine synthase-like glycosyltransferase